MKKLFVVLLIVFLNCKIFAFVNPFDQTSYEIKNLVTQKYVKAIFHGVGTPTEPREPIKKILNYPDTKDVRIVYYEIHGLTYYVKATLRYFSSNPAETAPQNPRAFEWIEFNTYSLL